jgi:hypothetical protein
MSTSTITSISFQGFKKFKNKVKLDLSGVNYIVGANNSGKTSLTQLLLILKDTIQSDDWTTLNLVGMNSSLHKQQKVDDIVNWFSQEKTIIIALGLNFINGKTKLDYTLNFEYEAIDKNLILKHLSITVPQKSKSKKSVPILEVNKQVVDLGFDGPGYNFEIKLSYGIFTEFGNTFWFENVLSRLEAVANASKELPMSAKENLHSDFANLRTVIDRFQTWAEPIKYDNVRVNLKTELTQFYNQIKHQLFIVFGVKEFYPVVSDCINELKKYADDTTELNLIEKSILDYNLGTNQIEEIFSFTDNLHVLGINRIISSSVININSAGPWAETLKTLFAQRRFSLNDYETSTSLIKTFHSLFVDNLEPNFYDDLDDDIDNKCGVSFEELGGGNYLISFRQGKLTISLEQFGNGFKQIVLIYLKIISIINSLRKLRREGGYIETSVKPILIIEEPEIFLHPNFESKLTDFFAFVSKQYGIIFILETHSEYILRRSQGLVKISPELINLFSISYFDAQKPNIRKIEYQKNGLLSEDFGPGFYDEASNLIIKLFDGLN